MLPFRKILLPVDYSEPCLAVVPYVQDMLKHFSAELTLVHSYGPASVAALEFTPLTMLDPNLAAEVRSKEEARLRDFASRTFPGQNVELIAELGEPGSVIHNVAQRQGTDLIMMATHGHGPLRRLLLGSVTAKVLHDVGAVVWTGARSALAGHTPRIPYTSMLCAIDDSAEAEAVLRAADALARAYQAQLSILHVVETPVASPEIDFGPLRKQLIDAARCRLRELLGTLSLDVPYAVIDASIADGIHQEVLRRKADLVVTGRGHAQIAFRRIWSHLYAIVRESPSPVLSV